MPDTTRPPARYWLLTGDVPQGPFDVTQVHARLASGEANWQTPACSVGGSAWLPLIQTPGLGPTLPTPDVRQAPPPTPPATALVTAVPPSSLNERPLDPRPADAVRPDVAGGGPRTPPRLGPWGWAVALLAVAAVGWLGYAWLRPLTPREVCEGFGGAKTAQAAKRYCTLNMHATVDAVYRQNQPDSDDPYEYTQEGEAPPGVGGYFVGIRFQTFVPEERRRVQIDGVIHLIKSDGWKIEDVYILSKDRQPLPEPLSFASNPHLFGGEQPGAAQAPQPAGAQGSPPAAKNKAKAWYEDQGTQMAVGKGIAGFLSTGGGKALGLFLLGIAAAVYRFGKGLWEFLAPGSPGSRERTA